MNYSAYFFAGLLAVLSGTNVANAVCSGSVLGVGTPVANAATGLTQYNIYDGTCKTVQTLQVSTVPGICDSRYFLCSPGTTTIKEYDDPTTGLSYLCTADATSESCGSDKVTYCCTYGFVIS